MAKILVVDNDSAHREEIAGILRDTGHAVETREDTVGLADAAHTLSPDLIILDIHFPEHPHAGIEAARDLSADPQLCQVPILVLSAFNQESGLPFRLTEADISEDFLPIDSFLDKPATSAQILERVETLLSPEWRPRIQRCPGREPCA